MAVTVACMSTLDNRFPGDGINLQFQTCKLNTRALAFLLAVPWQVVLFTTNVCLSCLFRLRVGHALACRNKTALLTKCQAVDFVIIQCLVKPFRPLAGNLRVPLIKMHEYKRSIF